VKVYIYQADMWCEECGDRIRGENEAQGSVDPNSLEAQDSDVYPQGPYESHFIEADTPRHCANCGLFLKVNLTPEGVQYVQDAVDRRKENGEGDPEVIEQWEEYYGDLLEVQ
jgi:hypothetical protein